MNDSNINLSISAVDANVFAIRLFDILIKEGLNPDDINLVHSFLNNLVVEHFRLYILTNNKN